MAKKRSEQIGEFVNFIKQCQDDYEIACKEVEQYNKADIDFVHEMEFTDNAKERSKIATKFNVGRKERRYYKDIMEETKPVVEFCEANKKAINNLTQLLGQVRKQEQYHAKRTYKPRVKEKS